MLLKPVHPAPLTSNRLTATLFLTSVSSTPLHSGVFSWARSLVFRPVDQVAPESGSLSAICRPATTAVRASVSQVGLALPARLTALGADRASMQPISVAIESPLNNLIANRQTVMRSDLLCLEPGLTLNLKQLGVLAVGVVSEQSVPQLMQSGQIIPVIVDGSAVRRPMRRLSGTKNKLRVVVPQLVNQAGHKGIVSFGAAG